MTTGPAHVEPPSGGRELHALTLPPGPRLTAAVAAALDGDGPAVLPLPPGLPAPALRATLAALRPTHLVGAPYTGGRQLDPLGGAGRTAGGDDHGHL
ncbi:hypothetical protein ACWDR9_39230, partial [Streptosporangium sandarakinum]